MPRATTLVLAFALLAPAAASAETPVPSAPAEAGPHQKVPFLGGFLRQTRIVYPLQVGRWKAVDEHRFDTQEAGVAVRYAYGDESDRWIDMIFYPVGALEEDDVAKLVQTELDGLRQAWLKDGKGSMSDLGTFRIARPLHDGKKERLTAYAVDLAYEHEDDARNSAMTLFVDRLYAAKARFSVQERAIPRGKARRMLEGFTADLAQKLEIASTGACFSPLPIEALAEGQDAPPGAGFVANRDGKAMAWAYPDRIVARDPASKEARSAMYLAMAMTGRMQPGCWAEDNVMPKVPEGMREIRIEYRAPDDEAAPAQRAQLDRSGIG